MHTFVSNVKLFWHSGILNFIVRLRLYKLNTFQRQLEIILKEIRAPTNQFGLASVCIKVIIEAIDLFFLLYLRE